MNNSIKLFIFAVLGLFTMFVCTSTSCIADQSTEHSTVTYVKASHILVDSKEEADMLKTKIDNGESFERMAAEHSKCPSGENGGSLGYFQRGQMVKAFEDTAFTLPEGKVSDPIRTQFGWHLIKVYSKK